MFFEGSERTFDILDPYNPLNIKRGPQNLHNGENSGGPPTQQTWCFYIPERLAGGRITPLPVRPPYEKGPGSYILNSPTGSGECLFLNFFLVVDFT